MKTVKFKKKEHILYHIDELGEKEKTKLKSLNPGSKYDEYVLSDDGYRIPITGFHNFNEKMFVLYTVIGYFKVPGGRVDTEKPYNGFGDGTKGVLSGKQRKFAEIYAKTRDRYKAVTEAYNITNRKSAHSMACTLLKLSKVKNLVDTLTAKAMDDLDINRTWILERLKKIADEGDADGKGQLPALKELVEIIGIKTKIQTNVNLPLSDALMDAITGKKEEPVGALEYEVIDENNGSSENGTPEEDAQ
jgi:hypothetical protein